MDVEVDPTSKCPKEEKVADHERRKEGQAEGEKGRGYGP
jgi:hypothetical protein